MAHDPPATTYKLNKERVDTEFLRNKLKLKSYEVKKSFNEKYPHVQKFFADRGLDLSKIREHSARVITSGALTGSLLLTPPIMSTAMPNPTELVRSLASLNSNPDTNNLIP